MHATIDAQFTVSLDPDKTLPLATLAESLTEIQLEATILEEIVRSLDETLVEAYCGRTRARKRRPPFPARWHHDTNSRYNCWRTRIHAPPRQRYRCY